MKTEFLKGLGLTQEQIDVVMAENGKDVEKHKADAGTEKQRADTLATQLSEANAQIESFKSMDIEGVKRSAEEWKSKAETAEANAKAELEKLKFDHALNAQISGAKARDARAVTALLDMDGLKMNSSGEIIGLKEQLEKLKTDKDFLFETENPLPQITSPTGGTPPVNDDTAIRS